MIQLSKAAQAWGTAAFEPVLKQEIQQLPPSQLPLQQALTATSYATDGALQAMIIHVHDNDRSVRVKAGIFFSGIVAGCSCADDPTPVDAQSEYCVLQFDIDKATGAATVQVLDE